MAPTDKCQGNGSMVHKGAHSKKCMALSMVMAKDAMAHKGVHRKECAAPRRGCGKERARAHDGAQGRALQGVCNAKAWPWQGTHKGAHCKKCATPRHGHGRACASARQGMRVRKGM